MRGRAVINPPTMTRVASLLLLACVSAMAAEAHAQEQAPAMRTVAAVPMGPAVAGEVGAIEAALRGMRGIEVRTLTAQEAEALSTDVPESWRGVLAEASRLMAEAVARYTGLDHAEALALLLQALGKLSDVPPGDARAALHEVRFLEGAVLLALRRPSDAERAFAMARRIDPSFEPNPADVPPQVIAAWSAAGMRAPAASGALTVTSIPDGATIWLDGVRSGTTPTTLTQVAVGEHGIVLDHADHRRTAVHVAVQSSSVDIVRLVLEPLDAAEKLSAAASAWRQATAEAGRNGALGRIASTLGVDWMLVMAPAAGGRRAALLYDSRTGAAVATLPLDSGAEPTAASELVRARLSPAPTHVLDPRQRGVEPPVPAPAAWYTRWWLWAAAGAVAAGATAAVLAATMEPDQYLEFHVSELP